jgi:signal transduction histidine kinase
MHQVVEDALEDALPRLKERGQKLAVTSDPPIDEILVRGDHDKLVSLVRNLLDNAMRYAPDGSTVQVTLRGDKQAVTLAIEDRGRGIPRELRARVFESYYRIPGSPGDGSGLGLAIVREIAAQHGATVRIDDGGDATGTRVTVSFPGADGTMARGG